MLDFNFEKLQNRFVQFHPADALSLTFFSLFCAFMAGLIFFAFKKAQLAGKFYFAFIAFTLVPTALVASGFVRDHVIPTVPMLFAGILSVAVWFAFSSAGARMAAYFSVTALVGFQSFRFALELILHRWVEVGTIPGTMSWQGQNFDIVSGLFALMAMPFVDRYRALAWTFQVVGFGLLLNVLRVVILSSPFPFSWTLENPLQLALYFPYVLIGPLFVAPALCAHLILARKLLLR